MIPNPCFGPLFFLLEPGDYIKETDEYYNPVHDRWLPVEEDYINQEFDPDVSKPVRRKNDQSTT